MFALISDYLSFSLSLERKWCNTICASHSLQSATTYVFGPVDFAKQNLTSRTTRCSMFYASLRSFKTWALRIPRRYCTLYFLHTSTILAGSWPDEARSDSSVKKRRPYHSVWPSFLINQRLPILPGRFQPSTFGVYELNYCVRDGNRWILVAIATEFVRACTLKTT